MQVILFFGISHYCIVDVLPHVSFIENFFELHPKVTL